MAVNKVVKSDGTTLIDITPTTATPPYVLDGKVFFSADGTQSTGTATMLLPPSAELVASYDTTINLSADTVWDEWTPSTTAKTLLAVGNAREAGSYTITSAQYKNKAVVALAIARTEVTFVEGTAMAKGYAHGRTAYGIGMYAPMRFHDYDNAFVGATFSSTTYRNVYYKSATSKGLYSTTTYGLGATAITFSLDNSTATSREVGFALPAITARCNSTYFSTACANNIDSANTNIYFKSRIWLIDKEDSFAYRAFDLTNGILVV